MPPSCDQGGGFDFTRGGSKQAHQREDIVCPPDECADDRKHQQFSAKFDLWTCHGEHSERRNAVFGKWEVGGNLIYSPAACFVKIILNASRTKVATIR